MTVRTPVHRLQVDAELHQFVNEKVLPGTGIDSATFWSGFDAIVADLAPKNIALLAERERLQKELDTWHGANPGPIRDMVAYRKFLETIGYLYAIDRVLDMMRTMTNVTGQMLVPVLVARETGMLDRATYDAAPTNLGVREGDAAERP